MAAAKFVIIYSVNTDFLRVSQWEKSLFSVRLFKLSHTRAYIHADYLSKQRYTEFVNF